MQAMTHPATAPVSGVALPRPGRLPGFGNMLKKELRSWFRTPRGLILAGANSGLLVGLVALLAVALQLDPTGEARGQGAQFAVIVPQMLSGLLILSAVVACMGEVVEEKKSGTAAWILSKPASRGGFILSKAIASTLAVLSLGVLVPGVIGLGLSSLLLGTPFPLDRIAAGLALIGGFFVIIVVATILLGVIFKDQRGVAAVGIGIVLVPALASAFLPAAVNDLMPQTLGTLGTVMIATGALASVTPIVSGAILTVACLAAAALLFRRQEL
jgi:ABC-2 type transport system permease protein